MATFLESVRNCSLATLMLAATGAPALAQKGVVLPERPVVGHAQPLKITPQLALAESAGGASLWTHVVHQPGASFLKLHLADVNLLPGDTLTLRSAAGNVIEEITGRGPKQWGTFWALSGFGDTLFLEFRFQHDYDQLPFEVVGMLVGDPGLFGGAAESICSPGDFEDVICYQADAAKWNNVLASVGVMSVGGNANTALFCSGSNVSPNNYVLTNDHCVGSQGACDNTEFVFRFYRTECNTGAAPTQDWVSFRCDTLVAESPFILCDQTLDDLDFNLCSVQGDPASQFGFASPDPVPLTDGEGIYIVQHPSGRPHEVTHGDGANVDVDGTVLRYYETLDTEGGSSGSPIFREADDKLVGLHHCGGCSTPGTGNRGMLMSDIYPLVQEFLCTESLSVSSGGASGLAQVIGNGDAVLDPGETWQFVPSLRNASCDVDALGVTATVQLGAGSTASLSLLDNSVSFGDIAAGQSAPALAPVNFRISALTACGSSLSFDLTNIAAANGGPFSDASGLIDLGVGALPFNTAYSTDFSSVADWSLVDAGTGSGPAQTWTSTNPGGRVLALADPYFICDSDELGSGFVMDEQLLGPVVDMSAFTAVELRFAHDFNWYSGGLDEQADVDVRSSATGGAWVNVANFSGADASGTVLLDISAQAGGQPDVQVRFHYYNASFEWWWAVDDVTLLGSNGFVCETGSFLAFGNACQVSPGGPPSLSAQGATTPGGEVAFLVSDGLLTGRSFLMISDQSEPTLGGCAPSIATPLLSLVPLDVDSSGNASLSLLVPSGLNSGQHVFFQYFGRAVGGVAFSNALDMTLD